MGSVESFALPPESRILVTRANGLLGAHIANKLLDRGYKVRGTVRDVEKSKWLVEMFDKKYGTGTFDLVRVDDIARSGSFDEAVKGISGVMHLASCTGESPNVDEVFPLTVGATLNLLESAQKEPLVKRFVLTSSACAVAMGPGFSGGKSIRSDTYNEEALKQAENMGPSLPFMGRCEIAYAAGKALAEKEMFRWAEEKKPSFTVNSVLPSLVVGKPLNIEKQGYPNSTGIILQLFQGNDQVKQMFTMHMPQYYYVHVDDCVLLHAAALLHPKVHNERVFAFAGPFTVNTLLRQFREWYPRREFGGDVELSVSEPTMIESRERSEFLLRYFGRPGFLSLEKSLRDNIADLEER